jgi:hypothetical protein
MAGELTFNENKQISELRARLAEVERESAVLRNNNTEDVKLKLIQLEHDFEDCKSENIRLKSLMEMTENSYK